jgi:hypothetical protein
MNYGNISNSNIQAINSSLYKPYGFVGSFTYNNIKNSYLDNFSSIFVDAGEFSNNLFLDNTYIPGTILPGNCFNSGSVELCENTSVIIETSTSISKLPSINIISIILSTLIIFGILL